MITREEFIKLLELIQEDLQEVYDPLFDHERSANIGKLMGYTEGLIKYARDEMTDEDFIRLDYDLARYKVATHQRGR